MKDDFYVGGAWDECGTRARNSFHEHPYVHITRWKEMTWVRIYYFEILGK